MVGSPKLPVFCRGPTSTFSAPRFSTYLPFAVGVVVPYLFFEVVTVQVKLGRSVILYPKVRPVTPVDGDLLGTYGTSADHETVRLFP